MQGQQFFAKPDLADNIKYNLKNVFKIYVSWQQIIKKIFDLIDSEGNIV